MNKTIRAQTKDGYKVTIPITFKGYTIKKTIGSGSTSIVCLIENDRKQLYSAKIIPKKYVKENNLFKQIESEISVMKKIDHPNIVKYIDSFEIKNSFNNEVNIVIVMEYCENGDLCNYLLRNGFDNDLQRTKITLGFLEGIKYLHERNISHGDIKLENILLDSNFNAKLADFGFCQTEITVGDNAKNGTLYYAAPEMFFTGNFNPLKSDIWSAGIALYCMAEECFPFKQNNERAIVNQITSEKLTFNNGLNKKLRIILEKCAEKIPDNRPSINEILDDEYFTMFNKL